MQQPQKRCMPVLLKRKDYYETNNYYETRMRLNSGVCKRAQDRQPKC